MKFLGKLKKGKVFCIGQNKTGTTSMAAILANAGFRVAPQQPAEKMLNDWKKRNFRNIIEFCKKYDAFQDVPFSFDYTFQALDGAFPKSKFILTVRDSTEQWYESTVRFHSKRLGLNEIPTARHLMEDPGVWKGWVWEAFKANYGVREGNPFDREILCHHYEEYNHRVCKYFENRSEDFLIINLSNSDASRQLSSFLCIPQQIVSILHLNKST
jgi:Sulfotransferase domain